MKHCNYCGQDRLETDFHWRNKKLGVRISRCKFCWSKYTKEHYKNNKVVYIDKSRRCNSAKRDEFVKFLVEYFKTHPCVDCGESDPIVLQFDHVRGKKLFNVCSGGGYRKHETILTEIAKCEVRCANCHIRKTAERCGMTWRKNRFASMM